MLVASVAVEKTAFSYDRLFKYVVPEELKLKVKIGCFVLVGFGKLNFKRQAVVFKLQEEKETKGLKQILKLLSDEIYLTKELIEVANFVHSRCFCSWFSIVKAILPNGLFYRFNEFWELCKTNENVLTKEEEELFLKLKQIKSKKELNEKIKTNFLNGFNEIFEGLVKKKVIVKRNASKRKILNKNIVMVAVDEKFTKKVKLTKKQELLFNFIKLKGEISLKKACYFCGVSDVVAKNLNKIGLVKFFEKQNLNEENIFKNFEKLKSVEDIILNREQTAAFEGILSLLKGETFEVALLKGVTGSGKTQVFLKLIDCVIKKGKECILLVPEISLTTQLIKFFSSFFGDCVAVLHSGISASEQLNEFLKIFNGKAKLVIGTRSAVFAPCKNLGLVIMDEEEGSCFKSSEMDPKYDAKDVAKFRCFRNNCVLLLSSATPSVTTNYLASRKIYKKFVINKRYNETNLPKVFVVNMLKAKMSSVPGISSYLFKELVKNFNNKEQSIIFLNRRGYFLNVFCLECGSALKCENCSAFMVYHKANKTFMCHYCGAIKKNFKVCENCGSEKLVFSGQGTQKLEDYIKENISSAKVLRLDTDTTFTRFELEEKIKKFEEGFYDILIGTQIVAKGLNFPNVTLVGVFSVDGVLFGTDFKSSERAFSLLTQVIGRSGRAKKSGRAIIQTYNPFNKIIAWAAKQDYDLFYENEIMERKEFLCPPFCDLCVVNFIGSDEEKLVICAKKFVLECKKKADFKIPFKMLGIFTPYISMVNKKYRKRIIIKCRNNSKFREWIRNVSLNVFSSREFIRVRANIDMNGEII